MFSRGNADWTGATNIAVCARQPGPDPLSSRHYGPGAMPPLEGFGAPQPRAKVGRQNDPQRRARPKRVN